MVLRHCLQSHLIGLLVILVRGVGRSAQCWKETFGLLASSVGPARYLAVVLATRSSLCSPSFPPWLASAVAKFQRTVPSMEWIKSTFLRAGKRNQAVNMCCCFLARS